MIAIIAAKTESDAKDFVKHWDQVWHTELLVENSTHNKHEIILQGYRPE